MRKWKDVRGGYLEVLAAQVVRLMGELPLALVIELNQATEKALHDHFVAGLKGHSTIKDAVDTFISALKKPSL